MRIKSLIKLFPFFIMSFKLPELPYQSTALEPHITSKTLSFHHGKHHQKYIDDLNNLVQDNPYKNMDLTEVMLQSHKKQEVAIFNNAAQAWNHEFYWHSMKNNGGQLSSGSLLTKIEQTFGSLEKFKAEFKTAGLKQFGSGWVWLVVNNDDQIAIVTTPNAANPMTQGLTPLITSDVWEHAYYLDFQNKRADYLQTFLDHLMNWDFAQSNYDKFKYNKK